MKYDLEERTLNFSKNTIRFLVKQNQNVVTTVIIQQLTRSSTSIGANYREANGAISKKDFRHKIFIANKEVKETCYWLEILNTLIEDSLDLENLQKEAFELKLIFNKIANNLR